MVGGQQWWRKVVGGPAAEEVGADASVAEHEEAGVLWIEEGGQARKCYVRVSGREGGRGQGRTELEGVV